ncbi:Smr domain-containing protein [Niabella drilacis]|uniref:Smr domain-containing protein n=1 Tax=Niabella drilacis (strain DSM 25811 / CCM 8410 / CCUG 62505 / LMG 26954 / E90) TaxID=1285928 RepID=A0A1G6YCS8_NIADE|nr:Smr domain-containing protein [Niabella drilacis]
MGNVYLRVKYQLGDKVLILHSDEEGVIVDFINDKMVMVDVRGVKFPVYLDQIDFPYFKNFTQKKKQPQHPPRRFVEDLKKEKTVAPRQEDGVWLNFLPVSDTDEFGDEVVELLKVHLVNNTRNAYGFKYALGFFGEPEFELKNTVQPFQSFYIHDVPFEDMSDSPSFEFEFSLAQPDKRKATHFETSVKIKPKQLFAKIEELRQKNQATFSYKLFDTYPDRLPEPDPMAVSLGKLGEKFKVYNAKEARRHLEPARSVVDLHIEKLTDDPSRLNNFEMLTLQLDTFEKFYNLAVAHMQPMLTVIHGVGTGKLRDEIHDALRLKKEVSYFVNQYHPSYGYGATEIHFKY